MVINIASSHRFHLLDLARELSKQGHDVKFYSYVPTKRCEKFGLKKNQCKCLLIFVLPFFVLKKIFPKVWWIEKWRNIFMDFIVGHFMRKCDVYIALGTVYLDSFNKAKSRFGAITILEWGSKHIDEQQRILSTLKYAHLNHEYFNKRSRKVYSLVDYIAIASQHVKRSFELHNYPAKKLFVNPYGVDLSMFKPLPEIEKKYDIIMVGNWSYQKGCDLISEAIPKTKYSFIHVGSIADCPFPLNSQMTHINAVDQTELINYYNQAKIFILPSRQDGFGMVLSQAMACNLPLIGSPDCGAPDLKEMVSNPEYVIIIKDYNADALIAAIDEAIDKYNHMNGIVYAGNAIKNLTWKAYGERYNKFLTNVYDKQK